jgi:hypothetical protein
MFGVRIHWGMLPFLQVPIIADWHVSLGGKGWRAADKSAKTEKVAGVCGCGKPEDGMRTDAENETAVFESKALLLVNDWESRAAFFPKDKRLITEGANFRAPRTCETLG